MAKSQTIQSVQTPKGELQWVTITGEGKENLSGKMQYVASIVFDNDDPALKKLQAEIDAFWKEHRPKKIKVPKSNGFYPEMRKTDETDEDGEQIKEPTGRTILAFKTGVAWPDGSPVVVKTYNSKGKPVALGTTKIGNGSIGRIGGSYDIYINKAPGSGAIVDAGVTFYLNGIQITKLVEFTDEMEFDVDEDDEDGFTGVEGDFDEVDNTEAPKAGPRL